MYSFIFFIFTKKCSVRIYIYIHVSNFQEYYILFYLFFINIHLNRYYTTIYGHCQMFLSFLICLFGSDNKMEMDFIH